MEPEVSSKEIQNSREISEMSITHLEEVTEDGVNSLAITSSWSPVGIFRSRSQDNCMMPDRELSFESLEPLEEDMAINEDLQRLEQANKNQEKQIQDLQGRNLHLENRVKELQMKVTKQQVLVDIINKLKENIEALIDDKYNVLLEKNDINKKFQDLQEVSANTKKHLQESKKDKETLQFQVKKIKVSYVRLQERYIAEIEQRKRWVSKCLELEKTLSQKDEELQRLRGHTGELEQTTRSALDLLKKEKEVREQEFLAFQEEFQRREKENLKERRKLKSRVEKLSAQVKSLLFTCESERAKSTKLQQQVDALRQENEELQQQVDELGQENEELQHQAAKGEAQACTPNFEIIQSREQLEEVREADGTQGTKGLHSNLFLDCSPCKETLEHPPMKRTSPMASRIRSLLALKIGLFTWQDATIPDAEHCQESKKANDIMLQKLRSFHLKERDLDKELLKHKNRIAALKMLIANEKSRSLPDHTTEIKKLGDLLEGKEDDYSRLIKENDKYRRHQLLQGAMQQRRVSPEATSHFDDTSVQSHRLADSVS
ncbi:hypothetical protein A6R68_20886, partial [Neotoma lepida]